MNGEKRIKLPSDTTLYAPALKLVTHNQTQNDNMLERISNFVEAI